MYASHDPAREEEGDPVREGGSASRMGSRLRVCPHCWGVNPSAERLCGSCGADMLLLLQESGGLRRAAAVQSPVPVRGRLSPLQRALVLGFILLLAMAHLVSAFGRRPGLPLPAPLGVGGAGEVKAQ